MKTKNKLNTKRQMRADTIPRILLVFFIAAIIPDIMDSINNSNTEIDKYNTMLFEMVASRLLTSKSTIHVIKDTNPAIIKIKLALPISKKS